MSEPSFVEVTQTIVPGQVSCQVQAFGPIPRVIPARVVEEWLVWPGGVKWYRGIPAATFPAGPDAHGIDRVGVMVCPECHEPAAACTPIGWTVANGPFPRWAHAGDGEALCPVMTSTGYAPARLPLPLVQPTAFTAVGAVEGGASA